MKNVLFLWIFTLGVCLNSYAADLGSVRVYYTYKGVYQNEYVSDLGSITIDDGTTIDVRIYKSSTAPTYSTYYLTMPDGSTRSSGSTTASYWTFSNITSTYDTWGHIAMVNIADGWVRFDVYKEIVQTGDPDLVPMYYGITPEKQMSLNEFYLVGDEISMYTKIYNRGDAPAVSSSVGYYLEDVQDATTNRVNSDPVSALNPKELSSEEHDSYIFTNEDVGTKWVVFYVDRLDEVDEGSSTNENNNIISYGPIEIRPRPIELTFSMNEPSSDIVLEEGENTIEFSWTGNGPDGAEVKIFLDDNQNPDDGYIRRIYSGTEFTGSSSHTSTFAAGEYYIWGAIIFGSDATVNYADGNIIINAPKYNLSGVAKSNLNNYDVIPDAVVQIDDDPNLAARTSWDGSYTIENIPPGSHTISISNDEYIWQQSSFNVNFDSDKTQDFLGHCKAVPEVTYDIPSTFVPGEPFVITVTLTNTNTAISDVPAYLDVSFPNFTETTADVSVVSQTGFDSNPQLHQPGTNICKLNTPDGSVNCSYPADWLLVSGERNATIYFNDPWSYTLRITPPNVSNFRIQIKGSIGDQRWPSTGVIGQQGYIEKEISVSISSEVPSEWGAPTEENFVDIFNNHYAVRKYLEGKYTIVFQIFNDHEDLIEDTNLALSILNYCYFKKEYLGFIIDGLDGLSTKLTNESVEYANKKNKFGNRLYRIRIGNAAFSLAEVILKLKTGTLSPSDLTILKDYIVNNWNTVYKDTDINTLQHLLKAYAYLGTNKNIIETIAFNNELDKANNFWNYNIKLMSIAKTFDELNTIYSNVDYNDLTSILLSNQELGVKYDQIFNGFAIDIGKIALKKLVIPDVGRESLVLTQSAKWHADAIDQIDQRINKDIDDLKQALNSDTSESKKVNDLINRIIKVDVFIRQPLLWELWQAYAFHLNNIKNNAPIVYGYISADYFWWLGSEESAINDCLEAADTYKNYSKLDRFKTYNINKNLSIGSWKYSMGLINAKRFNNLSINKELFDPLVINYNQTKSFSIYFENLGSSSISSVQVEVAPNKYLTINNSGTINDIPSGSNSVYNLNITAPATLDNNQAPVVTDIELNINWIEDNTPVTRKFVIPVQILSTVYEFSVKSNKEIYFEGDQVNLNFNINSDVSVTIEPSLVANNLNSYKLKSFVASNNDQLNWVVPTNAPKGIYDFTFNGYDASSTKIINNFKIDDAFIVLPDIAGDIENFDFSSVTIISPKADDEIATRLHDAIENSQLLHTEGLTAEQLLPAMQEDNLILVGGDQTGDPSSNLVKYLVDNSKIESGLWTQAGDANVIVVDDPFVPLAPYGNKAIVVAGYNEEDTYIAGLRLLCKLDKQQAPVAINASNVTQTSFNANWEAASNATGYYLDIANDAEFTSFVSGYENKDVGNNTSEIISGLTVNTNYYYRVRAYNESSVSDNSNIITQKTLSEEAVMVSISISGFSTVDENSSKLYTCLATYSDDTEEDITNEVFWSENSDFASIAQTGELTTSEVSTDEQCTITATYGDLSTSYQVNIKNVNNLSTDFQANVTSGYTPLEVTFTDNSQGSPTSWLWDFGDGSTSTEQNPVHVYNDAGVYTVSLAAGDGSNTDTETKAEFIEVLPSSTTCLTELFSDDFSNGDLDINWTNFGSPLPVIESVYGNGAPSYDNNGDSSYSSGSLSKINFDYSNGLVIEADFNVPINPSGCWMDASIGLAGSLNYGSTLWPGTSINLIYKYVGQACYLNPNLEGQLIFSFITETGDNESLNLQHYNDYLGSWHNFKIKILPDLYVKLFIDNELIYTSTAKISLDYNHMPLLLGARSSSYGQTLIDNVKVSEYCSSPEEVISDFVGIETSGIAPLEVNFTDNSTGSPTSWLWDFGDGTTSTEQNPVHAYQGDGLYTVTLTVTNEFDSNTEVKENYIVVYDNCSPGWTQINYTNNTTAYCKVTIEGLPASDGDKLAAFVGDECRGIGDIVINNNEAYATVIINGDSQETITFKIWDTSECTELDACGTWQTNPGGNIGYPPNYINVNVCTDVTQTVSLNNGWNLKSFYVDISDKSMPELFGDLPCNIIQIKNMAQSWDPAVPAFLNTLTNINCGDGYFVQSDNVCSFDVTGPISNNVNINLNNGWNLIGYPQEICQDVEPAFNELLTNGYLDQVKNMTQSYDPSVPAFLNTLTNIEPGEGYFLKSNTSSSFIYPVSTGCTKSDGLLTLCECGWEFTGYEKSTVAYGEITLNSIPVKNEGFIGAFVGDECRAVVPLIHHEGKSYASMVINGTEKEEVSFKLCTNGKVYTSETNIISQPDGTIKSIIPIDFNLDNQLESDPILTVNPNPFKNNLEINITLHQKDDISIKIYGSDSRLIRTFQKDNAGTGNHLFQWDAKDASGHVCAPGMYFIHFSGKTGNAIEKVILNKQ